MGSKQASDRTPSIVLAIGAHPDDIEFMMAGTLLLLRERGFVIHYLNIANGCCGSTQTSAATTRRIRAQEARAAAERLGAIWHAPFSDDLDIRYDDRRLRYLSALVREIQPSILLTHSPVDYMEDHTMTCRLAVTAAFARGMPNFRTLPPRSAIAGDLTLYHAMPHGLCDPFGAPVQPHAIVNIDRVMDLKRTALAEHKSQRDWLDVSQGMDSYLRAMEYMDSNIGRLSGK